MQQPQPHLLRIGDFSRLAQISISALRHYDELGLLKPAQVDRFTDYRYYALEQLPRLNRILALKDLGLSLDQIKQLLDRTIDRGVPPQTLREMLAAKQAEIAVQLREEQARLGRVEARLRQIEHEDDPPVKFDVVLKPMAAQTVISTRFVVPHLSQMEEHRQLALRRVYAWLAQNNDKYKMEPYGNEVFQYFNEGWTEDDIDTAAGVALDAKVARTILADNAITKADITVAKIAAAPEVASVMYQGRVWDIPLVISNLYIWIANNSYYSVGPIREVHLLWRECQIDEESLVLFEIQIPVAHE